MYYITPMYTMCRTGSPAAEIYNAMQKKGQEKRDFMGHCSWLWINMINIFNVAAVHVCCVALALLYVQFHYCIYIHIQFQELLC